MPYIDFNTANPAKQLVLTASYHPDFNIRDPRDPRGNSSRLWKPKTSVVINRRPRGSPVLFSRRLGPSPSTRRWNGTLERRSISQSNSARASTPVVPAILGLSPKAVLKPAHIIVIMIGGVIILVIGGLMARLYMLKRRRLQKSRKIEWEYLVGPQYTAQVCASQQVACSAHTPLVIVNAPRIDCSQQGKSAKVDRNLWTWILLGFNRRERSDETQNLIIKDVSETQHPQLCILQASQMPQAPSASQINSSTSRLAHLGMNSKASDQSPPLISTLSPIHAWDDRTAGSFSML